MRPDDATARDRLDLLDWKRRVFALYAAIRADIDPARAWEHWRAVRDELFGDHPQSPVAQPGRAAFRGLSYFPYDPELRVTAEVMPAARAETAIGSSGPEPITFERFAVAHFTAGGGERTLELYWLTAYGGGLFVPFRDETSGVETYGGGRYLLDTVKGADLGTEGGRLVLDFNFAYNPSCSYDPGWVCPLSPPANRLPLAIRAGEQHRSAAA